jgi:hypothetical protein
MYEIILKNIPAAYGVGGSSGLNTYPINIGGIADRYKKVQDF